MISHEEFQGSKAELEKKLLKRARAQAIILGLSTIVAVLGMLYGLINSIEAGTMRDLAIKNEQNAIAAKIEADKQRDIGNEFERQNADLKTQLDKCRSGK